MENIVRYGMVGGDIKAFIGEVHRKAIGMDPRAKLVAGSFSAIKELAEQTADMYHVAADRRYDSYEEMAEKESQREDGIDFVSICTPNFLHYKIAKTFLSHNINVVCEKPLCFTSEEARELKALAEEKNLIFAVTYSYTGYSMVKLAREMIQKGELGRIISSDVEYYQDWMIDALDSNKSEEIKKTIWRLDPKYTGIANTIGDIGTHAENMLSYLLGKKLKRVFATTDTYGLPLDMRTDIILEYEDKQKATIRCSQVAIGNANGLTFKIYGDKGSLMWFQEHPEELVYTPLHKPTMILKKGDKFLSSYDAFKVGRLPLGHPEGFYEAFANIYRNVISSVLKKKNGEEITSVDNDYPHVTDGLEGIVFVEKSVESVNKESWVEF